MIRTLDLHPIEGPVETPPVETQPVELVEPSPESSEFEIVLGRRQIAGVLFVGIVIVVVFVTMSYLAGKSVSPGKTVVVEKIVEKPVEKIVEKPVTKPVERIVEKIVPAAAAVASKPELPLFADPVNGAVYLQMGAVEKGIALIFAEGLRKHGFNSFVAPGPNEKIFRVLIGPLPDPAAYLRAKDAVDQIGLATFARKYQIETPTAKKPVD